jgi:TRAP transporter T-component
MHNRTKTARLGQAAVVCLAFSLLFFLSSCSSLLTVMVEPTVDNLQKQTDLDLVCEGAPAYLLMIDSMIASDPGSPSLLQIGAKSYSAYVSAMTECNSSEARIAAIADKARLYGTTLLACNLPIAPADSLDSLNEALQKMDKSDVPNLFWGALAWTTWIRNQHGSPASVADSVKVVRIMHRVEELDDTYQQGSVHLFFGAYYAAKPPLLGGRPDLSRMHFEKALAISHHRFLLVQTTYAQTYARLTMNKKLYNGLLHEVLAFPLDEAPDNALSNQIAKRKAKKLLADGFFAE